MVVIYERKKELKCQTAVEEKNFIEIKVSYIKGKKIEKIEKRVSDDAFRGPKPLQMRDSAV